MLLYLFSGFLLGIAGGLHCVGICGAFVSSTTLVLSPHGGLLKRLRAQAFLYSGRIATQVVAGAILGGTGTALLALTGHGISASALHLVSAAMLIWTGLALLGLLPGPSVIHKILPSRFLAGSGKTTTLSAGFIWALMPCGMVYGALVMALVSGSALSGGLVMLGFGFGTLPALSLVVLGTHGMDRVGRRDRLRRPAAAAMIFLGFASVLVPMPLLTGLCLHG